MHPARFELELTHDELLEICGPGTYRIEAIDQYGKRLACVATLAIGDDAPAMAGDAPLGAVMRSQNTNDLRIAMETIAQISRSHSESLRSLATAQADWIKTLATAKAIPRNGFAPVPMLPSPGEGPKYIHDDDRDVKPGWLAAIEPAMPMIVTSLLRNLGSFFSPQKEPPAERRNASAATHIARVRARLAPGEQKLLDGVLADDKDGEPLAAMLAEKDEDSAVALIRKSIKPAAPKRQLPTFAEQAAAVDALLTPEEREPAQKVYDVLSLFMRDKFVELTPAQGAELVRGMLAGVAQHQAAS